MRRSVFGMIIAAAFLAGGAIANIDILAEATGGNGDGAWAKLVARVTALEQQMEDTTVKTVRLEDNEEGHAKGWDPDGAALGFLITDEDVTKESIVLAHVKAINPSFPEEVQGVSCTEFNTGFDGSFQINCGVIGIAIDEGSVLTYTVVNKT